MSRLFVIAALLVAGFLATATEADAAVRRRGRRVVRRAAVVVPVRRVSRFVTIEVAPGVFARIRR